MIRLNHTEIEKIRTDRRDLEVEVAKALNKMFQQYYQSDIRRLVRELVLHIVFDANSKLDETLRTVKEAYLCFKQGVDPSREGLNKFLGREESWSLEECSDMIRLFGECNEKWEPLGMSPLLMNEAQALRPYPTFLKPGEGGDVKESWSPKLGKDKKPVIGEDGKPVMKYNPPGFGKEMGHRHRSDIAKEKQVHRGPPYTEIGTITRGIERYQFEKKSVVGAIDRTFGLRPEGADVSGTTTDSIYAVRWAGHQVGSVSQEVLRAIQILPIVTMVPQGHHTMVECAYPLSRWRYIDYCIGYYTTLAPIDAGQAATDRFHAVLIPFDQRKENKHILVWGKGFGERGVQMEGEEVAKFQKMARVLDCYGFCVTGGLHDFREAKNAVSSLSPALVDPLDKIVGKTDMSELEAKFQQFGRRAA